MPRRRTLVTLLVLAALVTMALPAAPAHAPQQEGQTEHAERAPGADVRIFQNGLAAVRQTVAAEAAQGATRVPLDLPPGVLFDTVRVAGENVTVREVRLPANATTAGPAPGDPVTVQTTKGLVTGTLLDAGDPVAVASGNETVFVPQVHVVSVTAPASAAAVAAAPRAVAVVDAPAGGAELTVTYLVQGPTWRPVYDLHPATGELVMSGLVENAPATAGANLSLVAGQPHTAMPVEPHRPFATEDALVAADAAPTREAPADQFTAAPEGTFEVFHLNRPVDLRPGEALRLPVAEASLTVTERRLDVEASVGGFRPLAPGAAEPLAALERVQVRNDADFLLPEGVVNFVRDGAWVGSDTLPFVAPNGTANLTVSTATRVDARLVTVSAEPSPQGTVVEEAVRVTNRGGDAEDVRVTLHHPVEDFRVLSTAPNATQATGSAVVWDVTVAPGATEEVRLTYELVEPR